MTRRQRQIFDAIKGFIEKHGYSPSFEEIGAMVGLTSLGTVHKHVHTLETLGKITLRPGSSRSIAIGTEHTVCCPKCRHSFEVTR